jgi:RelB Antitoxin alpha helical domain
MLEIHKSYVVNENHQSIAVQIPIEQFEKIEEILENYGLVKLIEETENDERLSKEQALKYYKSIKENHVAS